MAIPAPTSVEEPYEVVALQHATPTIVELWLHPLQATLEFSPGQYVLLEDEAHVVPPRSYSVANAPRADGRISLLVTLVEDGATSPWVHERLAAGETVRISGPFGTFVDAPGASAPALMLAAGSGLAPIRALVQAQSRESVTLVFSARTEADVMDRFEGMPHVRFIRTLTRGEGPPPHGRVPGILPALCPDPSGHDVFIAGAPGFVAGCSQAARALGAAPERVHTEVFYVEPQPWTGAPS